MLDMYQRGNGPWAKELLDYMADRQRAIVERFEASFRFVSLHTANAEAFSYELASTLRDAGSAFLSFHDAVVREWAPKKKRIGVKDVLEYYEGNDPDFRKLYIEFARHPGALRLQPFWSWTFGSPPKWWTAYNQLKHSEYKHIEVGNMANATHAISAVEIVLRCWSPDRRGTNLFRPPGYWEPGQAGVEHIQRMFEPC